jgi:hypothetical protein
VEASVKAGESPTSSFGTASLKSERTGTQGLGGLDSLHAPNDPTLIGLLSRIVATSAPPARTPLPRSTEKLIGTPAWLPVQTIVELEQISLAIV